MQGGDGQAAPLPGAMLASPAVLRDQDATTESDDTPSLRDAAAGPSPFA